MPLTEFEILELLQEMLMTAALQAKIVVFTNHEGTQSRFTGYRASESMIQLFHTDFEGDYSSEVHLHRSCDQCYTYTQDQAMHAFSGRDMDGDPFGLRVAKASEVLGN